MNPSLLELQENPQLLAKMTGEELQAAWAKAVKLHSDIQSLLKSFEDEHVRRLREVRL